MQRVEVLFLIIVLSFGHGCFSYRTGTGSELKFNKIYVIPAKNDSFAPQAQATLSRQIRNKLSSHVGLQIVSSAEHATTLEVSIIKFTQRIASSKATDTLLARSFDVTMTALCTLKDYDTGKVYFKNCQFSDSVECRVFENFHEAKYQAIPQLTEKLASKICEAICNPW